MNLNLKKYLLVCFICINIFTAKAQIGYEYAQYDIGIGGSVNTVSSDIPSTGHNKVGHINFNYNVSPFVNYVFEFQTGDLRGWDKPTQLAFINNFTTVLLRGQVQAGEIMDYSGSRIANAFKNLYLSAGVGYMNNHITEIFRAAYPGLDNSSYLMIPARIGYEFKVFNKYDQPTFKIDIGYQYNYIFGDNLDGIEYGTNKDAYSQINIGFKFALGGITSYRKQISY
jgi:hypothetical protein